MREVGHRMQPLGIRLKLLESIADLLDHLIKRVQSQMWQLREKQFLPEIFHWVQFWTVILRCISAVQKRIIASTAVHLLKRTKPAGARRGKSRGFWRVHSSGPGQQSMPPCWSRRIVAQYLCGHRARHIKRVSHAVPQESN